MRVTIKQLEFAIQVLKTFDTNVYPSRYSIQKMKEPLEFLRSTYNQLGLEMSFAEAVIKTKARWLQFYLIQCSYTKEETDKTC